MKHLLQIKRSAPPTSVMVPAFVARIDTGRRRLPGTWADGNARGGFTLIELMVVIVILGVLAGLIVPRIMGRPDEAKQLKARMQIESLESALKLYKLDNGRYPGTEEGLDALVAPPETGQAANWRDGGYLEKQQVPRDPWGNAFLYLSPGQHSDFDLMSYGGDGIAGGEGRDADINNWELE